MDRPHTMVQRISGALLGRTAERVRTTDWWMVFVEIAIVVLGILIAFQLDRWGDRRQARRDEQLLMRQIAEEARSTGHVLRLFAGQHRDSAANARLLSESTSNPAAARRYPARGDGCDLLRLPAVQRQGSGAIAQGAGPRIELLRDTQLRSLLRMAEAQRQFAERKLDFFRPAFLLYGEQVEPHMQWRFTGRGTQLACAVDIRGIAADPAAAALLPKIARDQLRFAGYREDEKGFLDATLRRIACLQSGRCRPDL